MWTSVFMKNWNSLSGMCNDFGIEEKELEGCEIIVASYTYEDYSGDAFVLFKKDSKFFEVEAGHCSCFGLSENSMYGGPTQWKPQEVSVERLNQYANSPNQNLNVGTCPIIKLYLQQENLYKAED